MCLPVPPSLFKDSIASVAERSVQQSSDIGKLLNFHVTAILERLTM